MHAVYIRIDTSTNDTEPPVYIRDQLAPAIKELRGFRSGIWITGYEDNRALSITIFDKLDQAQAMVAMFGPDSSADVGGEIVECEIGKVSASAFAYFQPGT